MKKTCRAIGFASPPFNLLAFGLPLVTFHDNQLLTKVSTKNDDGRRLLGVTLRACKRNFSDDAARGHS